MKPSVAHSARNLPNTIRWMAFVVLGAGCLYLVAGNFLAPLLIRSLALPLIAEELDVRLSVKAVDFDPSSLTLGVRDLSIEDKAGRAVIALDSLSADLDGRASLTQRRPVFAIRAAAPSLRLERDASGRLNLLSLLPPDDGSSGPGLPFLLTRLEARQGRIEYKDASGKTPFAASVQDISLRLENLGPEPDRKARFELSATTDGRATVSSQGALILGPFWAEGKLDLGKAESAAWFNYLASSSGWTLKSGRLSGGADYRFRSGTPTVFEFHANNARVEDLEAYAAGDKRSWIKAARLGLQGLRYALAEPRVTAESGWADNFSSPWLKFADLKTSRLAYLLPANRLTLESAAAGGADLDWLKIARLSTGPWNYDLNEERIQLKTLSMEGVAADRKDGHGWPKAPENAAASAPGDPGATSAVATDIPQVARIAAVDAQGVDCWIGRRELTLGSVFAKEGIAGALRTAEGGWRIGGLGSFGVAGDENPDASPPWEVRVGEFQLERSALVFLDQSVEPPVRLEFAPTALRMNHFATAGGRPFHYRLEAVVDEKGRIEAEGEAQLSPLRSKLALRTEGLRLRPLQSYWRRKVGFDLGRARLDLQGQAAVSQDQELDLDYAGAAQIAELSALDRRFGSDFIRWRSLDFEGVDVGARPRRFKVRRVIAQDPYARLQIFQNGGMNLVQDLLAAAPGDRSAGKSKARAAAASSWSVAIDEVEVRNGLLDFVDQTLKPNFAAKIEHLRGSIRGLSSAENSLADVRMDGVINRSSPVKIFGRATPASPTEQTDITMQFLGLSLPSLSPYAIKFAGYRIEKGRLDLDLRYKLEHRQVESSSRMILDQLTLGERVESPEATTLPVDFAVALLKDSDGRIDIDLPVSGNLDDPRFSLGGLYAQAAEQMLVKLINSPLAVLGSLFSGGSEELGAVNFRPGNAALAQVEKDKLAKLAEVLKKRPALNLDIKGTADPVNDRLALAESALLQRLREDKVAELRARGQKIPRAERDTLPVSDEEYRRLFTRFYRQRHPEGTEMPRDAIDGQPALEGAAFDQARKRALELWPVKESELRGLARARSQNIREYLAGEAGVPAQRIYLLDVKLKPAENGEIPALLTLSGN